MAITTHGPRFQAWKNHLFATPGNMADAAPIAIAGVPRHLFLFDIFLQRVVPHRNLWPVSELPNGRLISSYDVHRRNVDLLRADLVRQPNSEPVAPDEPDNIPKWRVELLDLAHQKAFYSDPPIPIESERRDAIGEQFEIQIAWDVDTFGGRPIKLYLTILCPERASTFSQGSYTQSGHAL
jgi:hypothetical protein